MAGQAGRVLLRYRMPLSEVIATFFDEIKSRTRGYATFDYEPAGTHQCLRRRLLMAGSRCPCLASSSR